MANRTRGMDAVAESACSIERSVDIIGERWSFLILREALIYGVTRYSDFQSSLGISTNILVDRLNRIVSAGVLEKRMYQEAGSRPRASYHATPKGEALKLVLAAIQQWGDDFNPPKDGVTFNRRTVAEDRPVRVGFVDDNNEPRALDDVAFVRTALHPPR
ncbi:MAG TPA: helix-turn-helix domain-containing protein [Glaciibacter sp.]|nr:helix-turn-helix domain-containing protein [Glaciibacter sp.]